MYQRVYNSLMLDTGSILLVYEWVGDLVMIILFSSTDEEIAGVVGRGVT